MQTIKHSQPCGRFIGYLVESIEGQQMDLYGCMDEFDRIRKSAAARNPTAASETMQ
jgi:hypothetical protein